MRHFHTALRFLLLCFLILKPAFAQAPKPSHSKPSNTDQPLFAGEPYFIDLLQTKIRFEQDGKGERDLLLRLHVQSESAIREFGLLVYPYMASFENLDVLYVRVRKPDGTTVETPASDIQELDSAVSREAPMYTDQREKHVAVKSLGVGDLLEVSLRWTVHDPLAPGHFWYDHSFFKAGICLKEEVEINVPANLTLKLADTEFASQVTTL
jgi:hypothetical protein